MFRKMAKFNGRLFLNQGELTLQNYCLAKLQYVNNVCTYFQKNSSKTFGRVPDTKLLVFCTDGHLYSQMDRQMFQVQGEITFEPY